ncbi:oxygenase MpaB family protein [Tomitella gaofuii]|uniref:oxygenase MpaB family protein n=1 Tax=Tomitella gaofuii TaxID=2760083 RepID=UPI0015FD0A3F|nr:oxygenase MpaB family protein [Tomitella gaofuii]
MTAQPETDRPAPVEAARPSGGDAPPQDRCPRRFRYWHNAARPGVRRTRGLIRNLTGFDIFPTHAQAVDLCNDLYAGDPVAERFVADVFDGPIGPAEGRRMLQKALAHGIDAVDDAPASMRALFAEFEDVPAWVDHDLVEQGAAIWRRWGTMLFSVAGAITLEIYTEAAVATPLSLSGGYAGDNALRRFLETGRFWIDVSTPDALFTPGSDGRATAMLVRVMHVAVRRRVAEHPEWRADDWGLPISQTYMLLTLIGGSVAPALALWPLGYLTSGTEIRALLHFQKYMGHLLGVQPRWFPETIGDCLRVLAMTIASRSYDAGAHGAELVESFPRAFGPRDEHRGLQRLRAAYNERIYAAYSALFMAPRTRARYDMPRAFPWVLIPVARAPLVAASEVARRLVPGYARLLEAVMVRHRANWLDAQMAGREAQFDAQSALRR